MLSQSVESYIAVRRATGFAFRSEGSLLRRRSVNERADLDR